MSVTTAMELTAAGCLLIWLDEDWPVALIAIDGRYYAVDGRCTHQDAYLHEGDIDRSACTVVCPLHQARFDLRSGAAVRGPAAAPLTVYPLRESPDGAIWLKIVDPWWRSGE